VRVHYGRFITLEDDINRIWKLHGWDVEEEKVNGKNWTITARKIKK